MAENVKKVVAKALDDFFQAQLKPQFDAIDQRFNLIEFRQTGHDQKFTAILEKQTEHDEKFRDILGHFGQLYQRLTRLEDEYQAHSIGRGSLLKPSLCRQSKEPSALQNTGCKGPKCSSQWFDPGAMKPSGWMEDC